MLRADAVAISMLAQEAYDVQGFGSKCPLRGKVRREPAALTKSLPPVSPKIIKAIESAAARLLSGHELPGSEGRGRRLDWLLRGARPERRGCRLNGLLRRSCSKG